MDTEILKEISSDIKDIKETYDTINYNNDSINWIRTYLEDYSDQVNNIGRNNSPHESVPTLPAASNHRAQTSDSTDVQGAYNAIKDTVQRVKSQSLGAKYYSKMRNG